jgi:hypothetical protein
MALDGLAANLMKTLKNQNMPPDFFQVLPKIN